MITQWLVSNFKSIVDQDPLELRPLTIISGVNSSGKSTILQSILFVCQTLQSRFKQQHLIPNGELVRLGTPDEILHFEHSKKLLRIGGVLEFDYVKNYSIKEILPEFERYRSNWVSFDINFSKALHEKGNLDLSTFTVEDASFQRETLSGESIRLDFKRSKNPKNSNFPYDVSFLSPQNLIPNSILGLNTSQFLPNIYEFSKKSAEVFDEEIRQISGQVDSVRYRPDPIEANYNLPLGEEVLEYLKIIAYDNRQLYPQEFLERLSRVSSIEELTSFAKELDDKDRALFDSFSNALKDPVRRREMVNKLGGKVRFVRQPFPSKIKRALDEIQQYFESQIHYLGPLRDDPRVIYAIPNNTEFLSVGLKGEYTAAMLNQYGNMPVWYPVPPSNPDHVVPSVEKAPLLYAVAVWLKHMGLVDSVTIEEVINVGYQLNVKQSGIERGMPLTRVGVGVSQVLPTLVMCLLVPSPSTLLIEQPELHLHPKMQSVLGDFFLWLTYCGKQCIVETHSEHLINRIFVRMAQDDESKQDYIGLRERTKILFAEKEGHYSHFKNVEPNEFGVIDEATWPKGFLDQSMLEIQRKLEAAKNKRRSRKAN